jgi:hypothetical protein
MADLDIVEIACARAWSAYILINRGIAENDVRRDKMKEFHLRTLEAGAHESELLAVEGLKYLKSLDGSATG